MDVRLWFSICLTCYPLSAVESDRGKVLFSSYGSIMELDVDTRNVTVLLGDVGYVYSLDYDNENKYVYFPRNDFNDIVRFKYPSQNITLQHIVNTATSPSGVAVDSANDHVYWVDNSRDVLTRCNSNGTNVVVLPTSVSETFMLSLDVTNRWMYIGYFNKGISKSRFDLTDSKMIANITASNRRAVCMDIDLTEQRLYWMNGDGDIKSINVDGSDVKTIASTNYQSIDYFAINVLGSYIYYADVKKLVMMSKAQVSTTTVLYTDTNRINSIYAFITTDKCSPNSCQNNGSCTNVKDGYTCTCTTGWKGKNCTIGLTNAINIPKSRSTGAVVGAIVGSLLFICMVFVSIYIGRRFLWCTKSKENSINNPETNEHIANKAITLSQVSDPAHEHAQYEELHTQSGDRTYYNSSTNNHLQNSSNHDYDYPDMVNYGYENLSDKTSTTAY